MVVFHEFFEGEDGEVVEVEVARYRPPREVVADLHLVRDTHPTSVQRVVPYLGVSGVQLRRWGPSPEVTTPRENSCTRIRLW